MKAEFNSFIEDMKQMVSIREVIGRYVEIGRNNMALCPFHDDTTPSLSINESGRYFHCFGCGEGGDVVAFIKKIKGVSFLDAVTLLAEEQGLSLPALSSEEKESIERRKEVQGILSRTVEFYQGHLINYGFRLSQDGEAPIFGRDAAIIGDPCLARMKPLISSGVFYLPVRC